MAWNDVSTKTYISIYKYNFHVVLLFIFRKNTYRYLSTGILKLDSEYNLNEKFHLEKIYLSIYKGEILMFYIGRLALNYETWN